MISRSNNHKALAEAIQFYQLSLITTQGRLRCPQHSCETFAIAPTDRFNPVSYLSKSSKKFFEKQIKHNNRSPRKRGRHLHAIARRPKTLTSSTNPRLASKASTRNFIDVPFNGFLGPSWEQADLTRILHHLNLLTFKTN